MTTALRLPEPSCLPCTQKWSSLVQVQQTQIQKLREQEAALKKKNTQITQELQTLRSQTYGWRRKNRGPARKRGAPEKHPGWFRTRPDHIDRIEDVPLTECPRCRGTNLSLCVELEEHLQEDIVQPRTEVVRYRKSVYWCRDCGKKVRGQGKDELPRSPIGARAKALIAFLKYDIKLSERDAVKLLAQWGLRLASSSVPGIHTQIRRKALPLYEGLKTQIRTEPIIHADETSASVNGDPRWDWLFASARIVLHFLHPSRGGRVVQEILGADIPGVLVSDFYAAYNDKTITASAKQKCNPHLLREIRRVLDRSVENSPAALWFNALKNLLQEALALHRAFRQGRLSLKDFQSLRAPLQVALAAQAVVDSPVPDIARLSKRLIRHHHEIFTFLDHPEVPPDNNFAERLLRLYVLMRKISGAYRSDAGVQNHNVLLSLTQTARLNGKDPLALFHHMLMTPQSQLTLDCCLSPPLSEPAHARNIPSLLVAA